MKIKIKVTQDILERSKMCGHDAQLSAYNCAIALAVRDIFPHAAVFECDISPFYRHEGYGNRIPLPSVANRFIRQFDKSEPEERVQMPPISFDIEVPDSVIEQIGISQVYKILSESKTLEYVG